MERGNEGSRSLRIPKYRRRDLEAPAFAPVSSMVGNAMSEMRDWSDMEAIFGAEAVGVIDKAIGEHLSSHTLGVAPSDYYLVSEGLTLSVLVAMSKHGLRFDHVVTELNRRDCPVCHQAVTITRTGKVRRHRRKDGNGSGFCSTSGLPTFRGGA